MVSSAMLRRVDLVRTDVSEEPGASLIRVTRIGISSQRTSVASCSLCSYSCHPHEGGPPDSPKRRFLQEPHGVTSQKTSFFNVGFVLEEATGSQGGRSRKHAISN
jgi:hypothetical protein